MVGFLCGELGMEPMFGIPRGDDRLGGCATIGEWGGRNMKGEFGKKEGELSMAWKP